MNEPSATPLRRLRIVFWITGIACVGCCAAPLAGIVFGASAVAGLVAWAEPLALGVALAVLAAWAGWRWARHRAGPPCEIEGSTPR